MRSGLPSPATIMGQGPSRARLEVLIPKGAAAIDLHFNPTEYKIEKKNKFSETAVPCLQSPLVKFDHGDSERLTTELLADTSDTLADVREKFVTPLRKLMRKDEEKHEPPIVRLSWHGEVFQGFLERLDVTYVLFRPDGVPLRAKLSLTLLKSQTVEEMEKEEPTHSPDVEKTWAARRGDTLAGISAVVYEDPRLWREIARANGIEDPRRLRPGTVLTVPRLR